MIRLDGVLIDMPNAERGFQRFTPEVRSNMQASHRLGWKQKQAIGEVFWTHPWCSGVAFPTRRRALEAALAKIDNGPTRSGQRAPNGGAD